MTFDIELLVMLRPLKRTQPSGDGIVAAWLDLHVVRRVRIHEMNLRAVEQPVNVLGFRTVAAQQLMIAEHP
jgi:hypothetical protein